MKNSNETKYFRIPEKPKVLIPPSYDECESLANSLCEAIHCSGDNKSREIAFQSLYEFYQLNPACYYRDYRENNESR